MKSRYIPLLVLLTLITSLFINVNIQPPPIPTVRADDPPYWDWDNFTAPANSFGVGSYSRKFPNETRLKQMINNNVQVTLEYRLDGSSTWVEGNQYMDIEKRWVNNSFYKYNFTFNNPVNNVDARVTFVCNKNVLNYYERSNYTMYVNYTVPGGVYRLVMDWGDLISVPGVIVNKGVKNNKAWIRFRKDNIPQGNWTYDPTFGYSSGDTSIATMEDTQHGSQFTCPSSGTIDNITVLIYSDNTARNGKAMVYDTSGNLVATSDETSIPITNKGWVVFPFSSGSVSASTDYVLSAFSEPETGSCNMYWDSAAGEKYKDDSDTYSDGPADPITWGTELDDYVWNIYCSYTESASNNAPVNSNPSPSNASVNQDLNPTLSITVNDTDANQMNLTFRTNASGSWANLGWYNTTTNGTKTNATSVFTSYNTKYFWSANLSDGTDWDNDTYNFRTKSTPGPDVFHSSPSPANGSTYYISDNFTITITINSLTGQNCYQNFTTNLSGSWTTIGTNSGLNTSVSDNITGMTQHSKKYFWASNCSNSNSTRDWDNDTFFFYTHPSSQANPQSGVITTRTIVFVVQDHYGESLDNVKIRIDDRVITTNKYGMAIMTVPVGRYQYEAEGLEGKYKNNVTISENMEINIFLGAAPNPVPASTEGQQNLTVNVIALTTFLVLFLCFFAFPKKRGEVLTATMVCLCVFALYSILI